MATLTLMRNVPIADPTLERFLQNSHRKRYSSRSVIIRAGDAPNTLYYIIRGSVSVKIEQEDGRELVLAYLSRGDFFGEMGLFDADVRSAQVVAKEECELAEMHYSRFHPFAAQEPKILYLVGRQLSQRLRRTSLKVMDLAFLDVTGRIARTLLDLAHQPDAMTHPKGMQIRITRQEIAKIVGCSREMAGRVLKELQEQELITARGKTIVVFGTR